MNFMHMVHSKLGGIWREFMSHDVFQQEPFLYAWRGRGKRTPSPWNSHPKLWIPSSLALITFSSFIHRWTSYSHQNGKLRYAKAVLCSHDALLHQLQVRICILFFPSSLAPPPAIACNAQEFTRTFPFPSSVHGHPKWAVRCRTTPGRWEDLFPSQASWPL